MTDTTPSPATAGGVLQVLRRAVDLLPDTEAAPVDEAIRTVEAMAEALELARTGMEVAAGIEHPAFLGFALTLHKINATLNRYHGRTA